MDATVRLNLENSPFTKGLNDSESKMQAFSRKASAAFDQAGKTFEQAFRRSKHMRAERAVSGSLEAFARGDIAGGIESISGRLSGIGLAAGVAIGAGVAIFVKFQEQIKESDAAARALGSTLGSSGILRGPEAMAERFKEVSKEVDALIEKSDTVGAKVSRFFNAPGSFFGTPGKRSEDPSGLIIAGLKEEGSLLVKNAAAAEKELGFKKDAIFKGESQTKIARIQQEISIKQQAIDEELGKFKQDSVEKAKTLTAEQRKQIFFTLLPNAEKAAKAKKKTLGEEGAFEIDEVYAQKVERDRQFQASSRAARLEKGRATVPQLKQIKLVDEIAELDKQLKMPNLNKATLALREQIEDRLAPGKFLGAGERKALEDQLQSLQEAPTKDTRRQLELEKAQKENELRGISQDPRNKFAFGTIAARNFENDQGGFGTLAGRAKEMNDANAFGSLAANAANRGETPLLGASGNPNAEVVGAVNKVTDTLIKLFEGT